MCIKLVHYLTCHEQKLKKGLPLLEMIIHLSPNANSLVSPLFYSTSMSTPTGTEGVDSMKQADTVRYNGLLTLGLQFNNDG